MLSSIFNSDIGKFSRRFIVLASPVLILIVFINYWVDPARIFDASYEQSMIDIFSKGKNVSNISNYDERIFQKLRITQIGKTPDVAVLGSSMCMLLGNEALSEEEVGNFGVSGASIEDLVAIYQLMKQENRLPQKMILGIDPWLFNKNNDQFRWQSLTSEFNEFMGRKVSVNAKSSSLKQLFSLSYFQSSVEVLPVMVLEDRYPVGTTEKYNKTNTVLTDGSIAYGENYRQVSSEELNARAKRYVSGEVYSLGGFDEISNEIKTLFLKLIKDIKQNNVEVEFFLAPYHPFVYQKVAQAYPKVPETEALAREIADEMGIVLIGSFDPGVYNLDSQWFFDGMHCDERAIKKIFKNAEN